ncbi:hypothetical protein CB1_002337036 [Camelus ferus]|nr:hypothetical protein CB1_002337036 [Camelus ferus]
MHSSCAGEPEEATVLLATPDLQQLPSGTCFSAKATSPSVFEALWGKAAPALAGALSAVLCLPLLGSLSNKPQSEFIPAGPRDPLCIRRAWARAASAGEDVVPAPHSALQSRWGHSAGGRRHAGRQNSITTSLKSRNSPRRSTSPPCEEGVSVTVMIMIRFITTVDACILLETRTPRNVMDFGKSTIDMKFIEQRWGGTSLPPAWSSTVGGSGLLSTETESTAQGFWKDLRQDPPPPPERTGATQNTPCGVKIDSISL